MEGEADRRSGLGADTALPFGCVSGFGNARAAPRAGRRTANLAISKITSSIPLRPVRRPGASAASIAGCADIAVRPSPTTFAAILSVVWGASSSKSRVNDWGSAQPRAPR
jgi:hypothetical protein